MSNTIRVTQKPTFKGASLLFDILVSNAVIHSMLTDRNQVVELLLELVSSGRNPVLEMTMPYRSHPFDEYCELMPVYNPMISSLQNYAPVELSNCVLILPDKQSAIAFDESNWLNHLSRQTEIRQNIDESDLTMLALTGEHCLMVCGSTIVSHNDLAFLRDSGLIPVVWSPLWPGTPNNIII